MSTSEFITNGKALGLKAEELREYVKNREEAAKKEAEAARKEAEAARNHELEVKKMELEILQAQSSGADYNERSNKAKRMKSPKLKNPEETTLHVFRTWKERFHGFAEVTCLNQECSLQARREILRDAIGDEWNLLWSAGVLQIEKEDDYTTIIDRIGTHIRARRNPLLDRKEFHERNQLEGESIDSYYAALQMISESCSFEEDILSSFICERCDSSVQHVCDGCKEPVEIVKKNERFYVKRQTNLWIERRIYSKRSSERKTYVSNSQTNIGNMSGSRSVKRNQRQTSG